jgi:hypothetical protein
MGVKSVIASICGESSKVGSPFGTSGRANGSGSGNTDHDNLGWLTNSAGNHAHTLGIGAHAHTVGIGAHSHTTVMGAHSHTINVSATGNLENTVKNIVFNYIVRLA